MVQLRQVLLGSITPVAPGRMRNSWYPRQHAEYLSTIEGLKPKSVVAERDFTFGMQRQQEAPKETKQVEEGVVETRTKLLPVYPSHAPPVKHC